MSEASEAPDRFQRAVEAANRRRTLARRLSSRMLGWLPERVQRILRRERTNPITQIIDEFARTSSEVTFVQIGSCDGATGDPLYRHVIERGWSGVVVEPVPTNFERLVANYGELERVSCQNVAIADQEEMRSFYHVRATDRELPLWCSQIGSFDRQHLVKHRVMLPELETYIVETPVQCITLQQLFDRCQIEDLHLLHTDVEGFDLRILEQLDFHRYRPELILYEDLHMNDEDRQTAAMMLHAQGYTITTDGMNSLARLDLPVPA